MILKALLPSCHHTFVDIKDIPYDQLINEMIHQESHDQSYNEPMDHFNKVSSNPIQTKKPRVQLELEICMITKVIHDDIEVSEPKPY